MPNHLDTGAFELVFVPGVPELRKPSLGDQLPVGFPSGYLVKLAVGSSGQTRRLLGLARQLLSQRAIKEHQKENESQREESSVASGAHCDVSLVVREYGAYIYSGCMGFMG